MDVPDQGADQRPNWVVGPSLGLEINLTVLSLGGMCVHFFAVCMRDNNVVNSLPNLYTPLSRITVLEYGFKLHSYVQRDKG